MGQCHMASYNTHYLAIQYYCEGSILPIYVLFILLATLCCWNMIKHKTIRICDLDIGLGAVDFGVAQTAAHGRIGVRDHHNQF